VTAESIWLLKSVHAYKQCSKLYYSSFRQLTFFQSDDTRCCVNAIWPPEDEQYIAWNMCM